jgi:hypothetical protein
VLLAFAMVIGRGIRTADVLSERPLTAPDAGGELRLRTPSRRIPLSPVGVALAATAVLLETAGYVGRLTGATGPVSRVLSMDAPYSAPRTFVSALFAVAAVAAVAGGVRAPGRRTWWLAVGLVCAGIAVVKAGGTVHVDAAAALSAAIGQTGAVVVSVVLAAAVLAVLRCVSRDERRDRRRLLGCLAAYAGASVGLSAVSSTVGGQWAATATYLEESGGPWRASPSSSVSAASRAARVVAAPPRGGRRDAEAYRAAARDRALLTRVNRPGGPWVRRRGRCCPDSSGADGD